MNPINYDEDLHQLDRIWPMGKMLGLCIPEGGNVLVAGAYEGRYMDYVLTRFKPGKVYGFEPQKEKAKIARARLQARHPLKHPSERYNRILVTEYGLGTHDCEVTMRNTGTDGCRVSGFPDGDPDEEPASLMNIDYFFAGFMPIVDLFICNMEGFEIQLLSYLIGSGEIERIRALAVQFHSQNNRVAKMLTQHYGMPVYDDFPTWMLWR